jgi:hypothetical protein
MKLLHRRNILVLLVWPLLANGSPGEVVKLSGEVNRFTLAPLANFVGGANVPKVRRAQNALGPLLEPAAVLAPDDYSFIICSHVTIMPTYKPGVNPEILHLFATYALIRSSGIITPPVTFSSAHRNTAVLHLD